MDVGKMKFYEVLHYWFAYLSRGPFTEDHNLRQFGLQKIFIT